MKNFFVWIGKAAIAGVAALLLLCLWCSFYFNVPIHYTNETGATEYRWESNKFFRKGTEGFAFGRTNNDGFNNLRDYSSGEQIDILLMGSSHMEGMNVRPEENSAAVLNRLFAGEKYTYNIGTSGHTLIYCLSNLEAALETYAPGSYVVIESRTLSFETEELEALVEGAVSPIPSRTGGLVELLQRAPYLRLIYTKYMKDTARESGVATETPVEPQEEPERMTVLLQSALNAAAKSCRAHGVQPIIVYDPTVYAAADGSGYTDTDSQALTAFRTGCEQAGILFVDLTDSYLELYQGEHRFPYGFANTTPGMGHMNRWGHKLFARAVYDTINQRED